MADISTFEGAKDWLLLFLVGAAGTLLGFVRRGDVGRLEAMIETLRAADLGLLKSRLERMERDLEELSSAVKALSSAIDGRQP